MSLGAPWGLLALAAIAPLLAAYFLRRRQKPVKVSALYLWRTPDQRAEAGPRFERFSRELSLLLEILAVIAAALYLADLGFGARAQERHVVVVVDGGLSMSARMADGQSAADRARRLIAERVSDADRVTIVESGAQPRVLVGPAEATSRALSLLEAWKPKGAAHDPVPALVLAKELAGPGQRIFFFTDALPEDAERYPKEVTVTATGAPLENAAIVAAQRSDEGDLARVSVRVANYGRAERTVPVEVVGTHATTKEPVRQQQQVIVPPGGSALLSIGVRNVAEVTVRLPDDALVDDGEVTLLPSPPRTVNAALLSGLNAPTRSALDRFLTIAPGVSVTAKQATLSFGPRGSQATVSFGAQGKQRTFVGPFFAERAHPVLEDVQLEGVVWTAGENPPGHPLLSANDTVLMSEDEQGRIHFNVDLARSNLQRTPAWPVLMGNLLRRAREGLPGLGRRHLVLGEQVPLVVAPGVSWALRGPGGEKPILGTGELTLPAPSEPGRYELLRDGEEVDALQVLAIDPRESDLRALGEGVREASAGEISITRAAGYERAPWPLLLLLALLLADFALTARGARA